MAFNTESDVVDYLLDKNLISPAHIVLGHLAVTEVSRRHRNYRVAFDSDRGFLLKQGVDPVRGAKIIHEARVIDWLNRRVELAASIPLLVALDEPEQTAIHELIADAINLHHYHLSREHFSVTLAAAVGKTLAKLHNLPGSIAEYRHAADLPWVLSLHTPSLSFYRECSHANHELIKIIQQTLECCERLDSLRNSWQASALTHGDIKWENFLARPAPGASRYTRIMMIDWELAGAGDACWDIGAFFSEYLALWVLSIPLAEEIPTVSSLAMARFPLEKMAPAITAFWNNYLTTAKLKGTTAQDLLLKSVRFSGARLLQKAFEQLQESADLTASSESLLQLGVNVLSRPEEAAVHLLGIQQLEIS